MKLLRLGEPGHERPAVLVDHSVAVDVSDQVSDYDQAFFTKPDLEGLDDYAIGKKSNPRHVVDMTSASVRACIARPRKIIGVGLNYADHATEANVSLPSEPVIFLKATSSFAGPYDDLVLPPGSTKVDWEVELGVVIKGTAAYLATPYEAEAHIAGYCVVNDVSERSFQLERGGQWMKGKSADGFCPVGPYLVSSDEIADVSALELSTTVNGERMQFASVSEMVFDPAYLVWYISQYMTLEPGDLICTGTPAGVGLGQDPPRYLADGDEIELEISGLGKHRYRCEAYSGTASVTAQAD